MCKRFFTLALCLCLFMNLVAAAFAADVEINETNFPDAAFRSYVSSNFDKDSSGGLSSSEIANVTNIDINYQNISSLRGIEFFTVLTELSCYGNQLTALDVSNNTTLTYLDCGNNQLTVLDVSNNTALTYLDCNSNKLMTTLDVSKNTALKTLNCAYNQLIGLDVSKNTSLTDLMCDSNDITELDVSKNTALKTLRCQETSLTKLDISHNLALTELWCQDVPLTALDVSNNIALTELICGRNQLTTLDVSNNTALTSLACGSNQLTTLDVSSNTALTSLTCGSNPLNILDVSKNILLEELYCAVSSLTALDLSNNPNIKIWEWHSQIVYKNKGELKSTIDGKYYISLSELNLDYATFIANTSSVDFYVAEEQKNLPVNVQTDGNVYFSEKPYSFSYQYNTRASSISEPYMDVTVILSTGTETGSDVVAINETNFPDATFRSYVSSNFDKDSSGGLSDTEIASATSINASISSLKGVEFFTALVSLNVSSNALTEVDLSKNTALAYLNIQNSKLTTLDVSKNIALTTLICPFNRLTTLDVSNNTALTSLFCHANQLTALDVSKNTALISLDCEYNQLTALDVSKNTVLKTLYCQENYLTTLDLSENTSLSTLECHSQIISIDALVTSDNPSYPYKINSSSLTSTSDFADRISSIDAKNSEGNTVTVSKGTDAVYFSAQPSTMTYVYDTKAPSTVSGDMDVTVNFVTAATDDESTSVNSRSYIHGFTMTDSLRNSILAAFPGLSASEIFQFSDNEIISDTWSLQAQDTSSINNLGESVVINLPAVSPSNTGVYVMRFSLADVEAGKPLSAHSVYGDAYSSSVKAGNVGSLEYKFFDENYNEVTTVPEGKVVYAAVRMTAGQTSRGVLTTSGLDIGNVQPVPQELRTDLTSKIRETLSGDISPDATINFIEPKNIGDPVEPSDSLKNKVQSEKANLIGKFNTLSVDIDGIYVWKVTITPELEKEFVSQDVSNFRIYSADVAPTDFIAISSVKPSFLFGLLNTFELLTMSGERMQFGAKEFLMVGFLNAGKPFSFYLAKLIFALLFGGCNVGFGVIGIGVLGFFAFKIFKRKN